MRAMKRSRRNVTITIEEDVVRWVRLQAARRDTSVSRLVGEMLKERMREEAEYDKAMRRFLARKPFLRSEGKRPTREELHDRTRIR